MLIVVIIGIVLLMLNVCACGAVIYQKHRVRQREDNLQRRIKRLSDAGMIRNDQSNNEASGASGVNIFDEIRQNLARVRI